MRVTRNNFAPIFQDEPYDMSISVSAAVNSRFLTLRATDADSGVFGVVKVFDTLILYLAYIQLI